MFSRSMRLEKPYSIKLKSKLRIVSRMIKSSQLRKFPNATKISTGWNSHFSFLLSLSVSSLYHAIYFLFNLVYSLGSIRIFVAFFFLLCCILYCKGKNFALERFWALSTLPEHFLCSCSAQPSEAFSTFSAEVFGFFFFFCLRKSTRGWYRGRKPVSFGYVRSRFAFHAAINTQEAFLYTDEKHNHVSGSSFQFLFTVTSLILVDNALNRWLFCIVYSCLFLGRERVEKIDHRKNISTILEVEKKIRLFAVSGVFLLICF